MWPSAFRTVRFGVETLASPNAVRPRHQHGAGYATVVLSGSFVESSFAGRSIAGPGEVLLHAALDCHANWSLGRGRIQILRLPWDEPLEGHFRVHDPDQLVRLSERDPRAAAAELAAALTAGVSARQSHWTHTLAAELASGDPLALRPWAEARGLRAEEVSRGFQRHFGVSPKRFRLEARTRRAWNAVLCSDQPLTRIAQDHEFADLAHMSRSIRDFTGHAPSRWRAATGAAVAVQIRSS
jgi:AraC-like DNA-binding protein